MVRQQERNAPQSVWVGRRVAMCWDWLMVEERRELVRKRRKQPRLGFVREEEREVEEEEQELLPVAAGNRLF